MKKYLKKKSFETYVENIFHNQKAFSGHCEAIHAALNDICC